MKGNARSQHGSGHSLSRKAAQVKGRLQSYRPDQSFQEALRRACLIEFGSQAAFAEAFGRSKGYISQLVSTKAKLPAPAVLRKILETLTYADLREEVYRAYIQSLPKPELRYEAWSTEHALESVARLSDHFPELAFRVANVQSVLSGSRDAREHLTIKAISLAIRSGFPDAAAERIYGIYQEARSSGNLSKQLLANVLTGELLQTMVVPNRVLAQVNSRGADLLDAVIAQGNYDKAEVQRLYARLLLNIAVATLPKALDGAGDSSKLHEIIRRIDALRFALQGDALEQDLLNAKARIHTALQDDFNFEEVLDQKANEDELSLQVLAEHTSVSLDYGQTRELLDKVLASANTTANASLTRWAREEHARMITLKMGSNEPWPSREEYFSELLFGSASHIVDKSL